MWADDEWVARQYFKHNQKHIAIEYAKDLAKCEYGVNADVWESE
jgi:hypothetical protein